MVGYCSGREPRPLIFSHPHGKVCSDVNDLQVKLADESLLGNASP